MAEKIEGKHPVLEALRASRQIKSILIAQESLQDEAICEIVKLAGEGGVPLRRAARRRLDRISSTKAHQGVIAFAPARGDSSLESVMRSAVQKNEPLFIILLDGIEDPQNLGAVLRTADAAGVHGVVIPRKKAAGITPAVAKVSAGASERVPVVTSNIAAAVDYLKKSGARVIGASMEASSVYYKVNLRGPVAFVIGGESSGIGRLVKEKCDLLVKIPMKGKIPCLNAAVTASLLMYEKVRQESA